MLSIGLQNMLTKRPFIPGVSNSNCSVGHMRTYKVTCGPHYDADATIAVPELNLTPYFLRKVS